MSLKISFEREWSMSRRTYLILGIALAVIVSLGIGLAVAQDQSGPRPPGTRRRSCRRERPPAALRRLARDLVAVTVNVDTALRAYMIAAGYPLPPLQPALPQIRETNGQGGLRWAADLGGTLGAPALLLR